MGYQIMCETREVVYMKEDGKAAVFAFDLNDYLNDVHLMQHIGLKDKYGKDIYEGDMLESDYGDIFGVPLSRIFMKHNAVVYGWEVPEYLPHDEMFYKHWKIIGNMHENKELWTGGIDSEAYDKASEENYHKWMDVHEKAEESEANDDKILEESIMKADQEIDELRVPESLIPIDKEWVWVRYSILDDAEDMVIDGFSVTHATHMGFRPVWAFQYPELHTEKKKKYSQLFLQYKGSILCERDKRKPGGKGSFFSNLWENIKIRWNSFLKITHDYIGKVLGEDKD